METKFDQAINAHEVWNSTLATLKEQVPEPSFCTWLEGTRLGGVTGGQAAGTTMTATSIATSTATVIVPSAFAAEWLRQHYIVAIAAALKNYLGRPVGVVFIVEAAPSRPLRPSGRAIHAIHALDGLGQRSEEHPLAMPVGQGEPVSASGGKLPEKIPGRWTPGLPVGVAMSGQGDIAFYSGGRDPNSAHGVRTELVQPQMHNEYQHRHSPGGSSRTCSPCDVELDAHVAQAPEPIPAQVQAEALTLNRRYTFDRFLVGRGNQLGALVARRVAEEPGAAYNPLFIYGSLGVGKTHLLQAIGIDSRIRAGSRVLCVSASLFEDPAARSKLTASETTRELDLLLVDDLHLIAGATGRVAQRSLTVLVEEMLAAGKGVVVSATQPPDSMLALHDTLRSRLRACMVVALELPDAELRFRVLSNLAREVGVPVAPAALRLLASAGQSIADVCAAWERALALYNQAGSQEEAQAETRTISVQDAQEVLAETTYRVWRGPQIGSERIIYQVASYFDLEISELCDASRERRVMLPRQIAMYLIREQTDHSYEWIARRFARQDHTTAMHSCAKVGELLDTDLQVRQILLELRQLIYGEHQPSPAVQLAG